MARHGLSCKDYVRFTKQEERAILDLASAGWRDYEIGTLLGRHHCSINTKRLLLQAKKRKETDHD